MTRSKIVNGRYRLQDVIGRGAHSEVYQALDLDTDDRVAVKLISIEGHNQDIAEALFRKEVDALDGLIHPNIVQLLDSFVNEQRTEFGIVLELISGGKNLGNYIADVKNGAQAKKDVVWRIKKLLEILSAIRAAHQRNVIHRDLKPTNILYTSNATLKVTDFGIARVLKHYASSKTPEYTLRNYFTPPFASHEQRLQEETTFASDLYAFAVIAVALLTLKTPSESFSRDDLEEALQPFRDELGHKFGESSAIVGNLIKELLDPVPSQRPHLPEVQFALEKLQSDLVDKPTVGIKLTKRVRDNLAEINPRWRNSETLALEDLNSSLCGTFNVQQRDGNKVSEVQLFGRTLQVKSLIDQADQEQLVAVAARTDIPEFHDRKKKQALPLPFLIDFGQGNAKDLLDLLFDHQVENKQLQEEKRERQELFSVAHELLQSQRRRLSKVALACTRVPLKDTEGWHDDKEFLVLRVIAAKPVHEFEEPTFSKIASDVISLMENEILSILNEDAIAKAGRLFVGRVHSFDSQKRQLVIKVNSQSKLPEELVLTITNGATESSLSRQEIALRQFVNGKTVNSKLSDYITHAERNHLSPYLPVDLIQKLEPKRDISDLVGRILAAKDIFLLQGPPGTGKTTIIAEVMAQILNSQPNAKILLTSQANEAVNNALDALRELSRSNGKDWTILRDVSERRMEKDGRYGLDQSFADWIIATEACSEIASIEYCKSVDLERAQAIRSALKKWTENLERYSDVKSDYAAAAHIYGATCLRVPALEQLLGDVEFDWVIVDEAAKATPSEVLVSIIKGNRILLVGDHRQLPPYLDSEAERDLKERGIEAEDAKRSLFEDLFERIPPQNRHTLRRQYRMHSSIAAFVSQIAYEDIGGLETGVDVDDARKIVLDDFQGEKRVYWLDMPFSQEQREKNETSYFNIDEARFINSQLKKIDDELSLKGERYSVGIIAPYAKQILKLKQEVVPEASSWKNLSIDIDTVDAFQGKQKDIMIYGMTRTKSSTPWTFIADRQRLNVAFSRAKRLLILVGNLEAAKNTPSLREIINRIPTENIYTQKGGLQ